MDFTGLKGVGRIVSLLGEMFPCLFQSLEASILYLKVPSSLFKVNTLICFHYRISFSDSDILPSCYKTPCDYIGPTQLIQDSLPMSRSFKSSAESLPPCKVTFTGFGMWTSWCWWGGRCPLVYLPHSDMNQVDKSSI